MTKNHLKLKLLVGTLGMIFGLGFWGMPYVFANTTAKLPEPSDFTYGGSTWLETSLANNALGNSLQAPTTIINVYFSARDGNTVTLIDPDSCSGYPDTNSTIGVTYTFYATNDQEQITTNNVGITSPVVGTYIGQQGARSVTCANGDVKNVILNGLTQSKIHPGKYVAELHADITNKGPNAEGVNAFKVIANGGYAGYSKYSGDKFALQDRASDPAGDFNLYFSPDCSITNGTTFPISWFDADWGTLQSNANFGWHLYDITANAQLGFLTGGGGWNYQSNYGGGVNGNGGFINGTNGSISLGGIGSETSYLGFKFYKNHIYRWQWTGVNHDNGIQFQIPFDSYNTLASCPTTRPPTGTATMACDVNSSNQVVYQIKGSVSDPNNPAAPLPMYVNYEGANGQPIVGMARTPSGNGYWLVSANGTVYNFGDAHNYGSISPSIHLAKPIVGIAARPQGDGYWLVAADGGVFQFGNAPYLGNSVGAEGGTFYTQYATYPKTSPENSNSVTVPAGYAGAGQRGFKRVREAVGIASSYNGGGYYIVANDGGVFTYGNAAFHGSGGNAFFWYPVVGMATSTTYNAQGVATGNNGYWLTGQDGGVFNFGPSLHDGTSGTTLSAPVVGIAPFTSFSGGKPTGTPGYWLVAADGGVFQEGAAPFYGSEGNTNLSKPAVTLVPTANSAGYWIAAGDGGVFTHGNAGYYSNGVPGSAIASMTSTGGSSNTYSVDLPVQYDTLDAAPNMIFDVYAKSVQDGQYYKIGSVSAPGLSNLTGCGGSGGVVAQCINPSQSPSGTSVEIGTNVSLTGFGFKYTPAFPGFTGPVSYTITFSLAAPSGTTTQTFPSPAPGSISPPTYQATANTSFTTNDAGTYTYTWSVDYSYPGSTTQTLTCPPSGSSFSNSITAFAKPYFKAYGNDVLAGGAFTNSQCMNGAAITSTANNGGNAQFVTDSTFGLHTGAAVNISGTNNYNGSWTVSTVDSATKFTINKAYVDSETGGWSLTPTQAAGTINALNNGVAAGGTIRDTNSYAFGTTKLTTTSTAGMSTGDTVIISGTTSYNGPHQVLVLSPTAFAIATRYTTHDKSGSWIPNSSYSGSGGQFGANALGVISGFASADLRAGQSTPIPPTGLTFANDNTSTYPYGGNFGGSNCIHDWYGDLPNASATDVSSQVSSGKLNLIPYFNPGGGARGSGAYSVTMPSGSSPLELADGNSNNAPNNKQLSNGTRLIFYIKGDVYIPNNLTYAAWATLADVPSFWLVVQGNIYIGSGVTNLDGVYVAEPDYAGAGGNIYTCANSSNGWTANDIKNISNTDPSQCGSQLTVNGAFVANNIDLLRGIYSLKDATANELPSGSHGAEIFNFSPEIYLAPPPGLGSSSVGKYDAITELPPVL